MRISQLLFSSLVAVAACNPEGMGRAAKQQPNPNGATVLTSTGAVGASTAPTGRVGASSATASQVGANVAGVTGGAIPPAVAQPAGAPAAATATGAPGAKLHLRMSPGRTKQDSTSFYAAVRAGMRAASHWPSPPAILPGSILPGKRIVAYYGNPLSKKMGILGELPPAQMLARLDSTVAEWRAADPSTPVQPALHLIAVVAQGAPGKDGMYRLRMDTSLIEKVYGWAQSRHAILFLDIQAAHSTLQAELPRLMPLLARPDVHLAVDPEFYMHYDKEGLRPGTKIGTMHAKDVNDMIRALTQLVIEKHLPPKILVVHRFTSRMVPDAEDIRPTPQVQVVMDMDGWGPPWLKFDSYRDYEVRHPVEFTGFKLFYQNDTKKGFPLLTPYEVLQLVPKPIYIQYQ